MLTSHCPRPSLSGRTPFSAVLSDPSRLTAASAIPLGRALLLRRRRRLSFPLCPIRRPRNEIRCAGAFSFVVAAL